MFNVFANFALLLDDALKPATPLSSGAINDMQAAATVSPTQGHFTR